MSKSKNYHEKQCKTRAGMAPCVNDLRKKINKDMELFSTKNQRHPQKGSFKKLIAKTFKELVN